MRSYASLSPEAEFRKRYGSYGFTRASVVVVNMSIVVFKVTIRGSDLRIHRWKAHRKRIVSTLLSGFAAVPVSASTVITVSGGDKVIP